MNQYNVRRQRPSELAPRSVQESTRATERSDRANYLIDRKVLHNTRPFFQTLLAIVLWANSLGTTIFCAMWVEQRMMGAYSWIGAAVGVIVAVVLTLVQIYTADVSPGGYLVALLPDVVLTAAPHYVWLYIIASFFFGNIAGILLAGIGAAVLGYFSARLPEKLVFGARRVR